MTLSKCGIYTLLVVMTAFGDVPDSEHGHILYLICPADNAKKGLKTGEKEGLSPMKSFRIRYRQYDVI